MNSDIKNKLKNHPCFDDQSRYKYARVHLPVAPRCNIQCNFCNRQFDCVNESRPGVTSTILSPNEAFDYFKEVNGKINNISVVGIAGPGDPFANPIETMETLRLIRKQFPDIMLCIATNGLSIIPYIDELKELNVSHITITINAIDKEIGKKIYSWVRYNKRIFGAEEGFEILIKNQLEAVKMLKEKNITVKINSIIIPGINDYHIADIAKKSADLNADIFNAIPFYKNSGCVFSEIDPPENKEVEKIRKECERFISQMRHCRRCRADAVGFLNKDMSNDLIKSYLEKKKCIERLDIQIKKPDNKHKRPFIAVTSYENILINQHLGEAKRILIYKYDQGVLQLIEERKTPDPGIQDKRWVDLSVLLKDCQYILVNGIGENPRRILLNSGVSPLIVEGVIKDVVENIYTGKSINKFIKKSPMKCGQACSGSGGGCG